MKNDIYWIMLSNSNSYFRNVSNLTHTEENYLNQMLRYKMALFRGWVLAAAILIAISLRLSMGIIILALILVMYFLWYQETKKLFYEKFTEYELMKTILDKVDKHKRKA